MRRAVQDKALKEQRYEFRQWKHWRRERFEELLKGPYAEPARALVEFCKTITTGPTALIEHVKRGPWRDADPNVRVEILTLVAAVIIARREKLETITGCTTQPLSNSARVAGLRFFRVSGNVPAVPANGGE
jgi:enamine deaminase RidA (YjgF/YER057c/UK114 family)